MAEFKWDVFCILCAVRFLRCVCQWGFYFREVCVFGLVCMWLCICRSIDCCVCVRRYKGASGSSAVCAFTMDQVEEAFNGRYREVNRETQQWYTYNHPVPEPRPGAVSLSSLQKLLDGVPQNRSVMWMLGHSKKKYIVIIYSPSINFKSVWLCLFSWTQRRYFEECWLLKSFHSHWIHWIYGQKIHWKSMATERHSGLKQMRISKWWQKYKILDELSL